MAIRAFDYKFSSSQTVDFDNYDSTKATVGSLIKINTGPNPDDNFISPLKLVQARPMEVGNAIPALHITDIKFSDTIYWVFYGDGATAAATRRVGLYEYSTVTQEFTWKGFVTLSYPAGATGNKTVRAQDVTRDLYTTGTVSCTGNSTITGSGTAWQSNRLSAGSRIGFGSTNPSQITIWYEIQSIDSDTQITLTTNGPTITGNSYVIEDLRITQVLTSSIAAGGGLFVVKGLRYENFNAGGTAISAASTVDNVRAVYWLRDASTVTHTTGYGCAIDSKASWTSQDVYSINANAVASGRIFKYNLRESLSDLSGGASNLAYTLQTAQVVTTGNISVTSNGVIATTSHGAGNGVKSMYWVTATRVYRSILADITNGGVNWQSDSMVETPPGGTNTMTASSVFSNIVYLPSIDRFLINTTGANSVRNYITQYETSALSFENVITADSRLLTQSTSNSNVPPHLNIHASTFTGAAVDGILFYCRFSAAASLSQLYSVCVGAHKMYAFNSEQYIITPKINLSGANKIYSIATRIQHKFGDGTFEIPAENIDVYYRTTGIDDNTGAWTILSESCDLTNISPGNIQFAYLFNTIGTFSIPARIFGFSVIYEDESTDSHYLPSIAESSVLNKQFAYQQILAFGSNIPELRIRIYNIANNALVLDDTTTLESSGTFEYSTDGTTWSAWDDTQDTVGNYIRYTAASLPNNIKVKVLLTQ
jgi:hypothetical protein